jgi:hypothetical protein
MLNRTTRNILVQLGAINQSQIISYPVTVIKMGKSVQAFLDVSKPADKENNLNGCNETEFEDIGVYIINELNSVISVVDKPTITNNNGVLEIKNETQAITYATTPLDILESDCRGNPGVISNIKNPERNTLLTKFKLSTDNLDKIKKMSGLLKNLSDLKINAGSESAHITVTSKEKSANSYDIKIPVIPVNTAEDIEVTLLMDNINKLPASDYEVQVYRSQKGGLITVFTSLNVDGLDIIISAKAD